MTRRKASKSQPAKRRQAASPIAEARTIRRGPIGEPRRETAAERRAEAAWPTRPLLVTLFVVAFVLRCGYVLGLEETVLPSLLLGDAQSYDSWAQEIAGGKWIGDQVFYQAPFYPYFLALVYSVFGHSLLAARLIQCLLGAGACLLLAKSGSSFLSPRAGVLAGFLLAFYPPGIFFDGLIQKGSLDLFLTCLLLHTLGRQLRDPGWRWPLVAGVVMGCLALTRENAMVLFVVLLPWLFLHRRGEPLATRLGWPALLLAGAAVVLLPVGLRNKAIGGEFLLTTSQLGPNFYMGNNPEATGQHKPLIEGRDGPRFERVDATQLAEQATGRTLRPAEVSRYWLRRSLDSIRAEPRAWLRLLLAKWMLVWNARELVDTESIEMYRDHSPLLWGLGLVHHFGVLCPLAAAGIFISRRGWRRLWPLYGILLVFAAAVAVFYVFARYRLTLVPVLALFAGHALAQVPRLWRSGARRELAAAALLAAIAAAWVNWPIPAQYDPHGISYLNVGMLLAQQGRQDEAIEALERSVQYTPDSGFALMTLGNTLVQAGRSQEAVTYMERARALDPSRLDVRLALGTALMSQQRWREAEEHLRAAVEIDPASWLAHVGLATAARMRGDLDLAVRHYEAALELNPQQSDVRFYLLASLAQQRRWEGVLRHAEHALRLDSRDANAHVFIGRALAAQGADAEQTLARYRTALEYQPGHVEAQRELAWLLATYPDPAVRDGAVAVHFAEQAARTTKRQDAAVLDVLAAAQAEAGRFAEAAATAGVALELAGAAGERELAGEIESRRRLYREQRPYRQPALPRRGARGLRNAPTRSQ